jgi:hypothetical protein
MSIQEELHSGEEWPEGLDWFDAVRRAVDRRSDEIQEWQGLPVPVEGFSVRLCKGHPWANRFREYEQAISMDIVAGGPDDIDDEYIVNKWFCRQRSCDVYVYRKPNRGRSFAVKVPVSPDRSMDRLTLGLKTLGASDAWDMDAEVRAMEKLAGLLSERQWRHYCLTGTFIETSPRSHVTYVFRRLRPTVALSPRWSDGKDHGMRFLAALCLHPVGFYEDTWGGCMVPSDDVIAHLLMMRGDEAHFWGKAVQHQGWEAEAGL